MPVHINIARPVAVKCIARLSPQRVRFSNSRFVGHCWWTVIDCCPDRYSILSCETLYGSMQLQASR